jgi:hypothetical protein
VLSLPNQYMYQFHRYSDAMLLTEAKQPHINFTDYLISPNRPTPSANSISLISSTRCSGTGFRVYSADVQLSCFSLSMNLFQSYRISPSFSPEWSNSPPYYHRSLHNMRYFHKISKWVDAPIPTNKLLFQ